MTTTTVSDRRTSVRQGIAARYEQAKEAEARKKLEERRESESLRNRERRRSPEGAAYMRNYRVKNRDKIASSVKKYYRTVGGRYRHMKAKARSKGIEFRLTEEDYSAIVAKPCRYCGGDLPKAGHGVDRMDSRAGYSPRNCVPCCTACNMVKGTMPANVWAATLAMILDEHGLEGEPNPWDNEAIAWMVRRRARAGKGAP